MTQAYNFDPNDVDGADELGTRIKQANTVTDWSHILKDHLSFGNSKVADHVAIFNMNAAHDCPNKQTMENGESETGLCQVPWDSCYAQKAESMYGTPLDYRRRQELLWDHLDPVTFAKAFLEVVDRKRNRVTALRFNEAGDMRSKQDVYKADEIARILNEEADIDVICYSASYKLDNWHEVDHLVVNESVSFAEYGDRNFGVVNERDDIPEDGVQCPYQLQKQNGVNEPMGCGDCRLCFEKEGPDVYTVLH